MPSLYVPMTPRGFAQKVCEQLNAQQWSLPFTARRGYVPKLKLEQLGPVRVVVCPKAFVTSREDETGWRHAIDVDIGITQKIKNQLHKIDKASQDTIEDTSQTDELNGLVTDIISWIQSDTYAPPFGFEVDAILAAPLYHQEWLIENHQFLSVLTLRFSGTVGDDPDED